MCAWQYGAWWTNMCSTFKVRSIVEMTASKKEYVFLPIVKWWVWFKKMLTTAKTWLDFMTFQLQWIQRVKVLSNGFACMSSTLILSTHKICCLHRMETICLFGKALSKIVCRCTSWYLMLSQSKTSNLLNKFSRMTAQSVLEFDV